MDGDGGGISGGCRRASWVGMAGDGRYGRGRRGGDEKHETPILCAKDRGLGRIMSCLSGSVLLTQRS